MIVMNLLKKKKRVWDLHYADMISRGDKFNFAKKLKFSSCFNKTTATTNSNQSTQTNFSVVGALNWRHHDYNLSLQNMHIPLLCSVMKST